MTHVNQKIAISLMVEMLEVKTDLTIKVCLMFEFLDSDLF